MCLRVRIIRAHPFRVGDERFSVHIVRAISASGARTSLTSWKPSFFLGFFPSRSRDDRYGMFGGSALNNSKFLSNWPHPSITFAYRHTPLLRGIREATAAILHGHRCICCVVQNLRSQHAYYRWAVRCLTGIGYLPWRMGASIMSLALIPDGDGKAPSRPLTLLRNAKNRSLSIKYESHTVPPIGLRFVLARTRTPLKSYAVHSSQIAHIYPASHVPGPCPNPSRTNIPSCMHAI